MNEPNKNYVVHHFSLEQAKRLVSQMDSAFELKWQIFQFLNELYDKDYEICYTTEEKDNKKSTEN